MYGSQECADQVLRPDLSRSFLIWKFQVDMTATTMANAMMHKPTSRTTMDEVSYWGPHLLCACPEIPSKPAARPPRVTATDSQCRNVLSAKISQLTSRVQTLLDQYVCYTTYDASLRGTRGPARGKVGFCIRCTVVHGHDPVCVTGRSLVQLVLHLRAHRLCW